MKTDSLDFRDFCPSPELPIAETMPARWYIEPEFLALEAERIFYKTWQPIGRLEDVMRVGDFFSCEVLDQPLVVVRNRAGELRAFYNVCPIGRRWWRKGAATAKACNASPTVGHTISMAS